MVGSREAGGLKTCFRLGCPASLKQACRARSAFVDVLASDPSAGCGGVPGYSLSSSCSADRLDLGVLDYVEGELYAITTKRTSEVTTTASTSWRSSSRAPEGLPGAWSWG